MILDNDFYSDNRVQKEAETLISNGYSVEVLCVTTVLPGQEIRNRIKITRMLHPNISTRPFSKMAVNSYYQAVHYIVRKGFDVVHCHDYNVIHIGAAVKRKVPDIKLVYDAHEYFEAFAIHKNVNGVLNSFKAKLVWRYLLRREQRAAIHFDALISTTTYIAKKLSVKFGIDNFFALRNIPESAEIKPNNFIREKLNFPHTAKVIVHSGNIYFGEDILHQLHQSLKTTSPDLRLVFLISKDRGTHIKEAVQHYGYSDLIHFLDYPKKEEIVSILSSADIGFSWVNPQFQSHYYTSANRYWEYTMAQLPVISNPQKEIEEQLSIHKNGIIYDDFDNGIQRILDAYDAFKKGAVVASSLNSWETESNQLLSLYKKLFFN